MARGINKVILVGHLGQDPEQRFLPSGGEVCNISVATTDSWKDKQSGQKKERTEWHRVTIFNKLAEIANQYLKKGTQVYIEGRLQTRKWQDNNGQDRYTTEIIATVMQMLGGNSNSGTRGPQQNQQRQSSAQNQGQSQPSAMSGPDDFDDDIPF